MLAGGMALLAANILVYIDRMHGQTRACRSARDFCAVSFGFFLVASAALLKSSNDRKWQACQNFKRPFRRRNDLKLSAAPTRPHKPGEPIRNDR